MLRHSGIICRMLKSVFRHLGYQFCLAACLVLTAGNEAKAFPSGQSIGAVKPAPWRQTGTLLIRAGLCPDGSEGCLDDAQAPQYAPPARPNYLRPDPAPYYEQARPETLPPCEEKRYAAYAFQPHEPPPHKPYYEEELKGPCGVRCWYRRLSSGYCGRGCDYYLYRLNKFPESKSGGYRHKRLACR